MQPSRTKALPETKDTITQAGSYSSNASMATNHAARMWDQGKELARRPWKGNIKMSALNKHWDIGLSAHNSPATENAIPISPASSKRASEDVTPQPTASKGKGPAQEAPTDGPAEPTRKKVDESCTGLGIILAESAQRAERFQDNPVGVGCHRWFAAGSWCHTSNTFQAIDKPLPEIQKASDALDDLQKDQQYPDGCGQNGLCDTPGMKLIKDGVTAVRNLGKCSLSQTSAGH